MFGILSSVQQQQNVWRKWIDYIESKKTKLSLTKAALISSDGEVASASTNFILQPCEINDIFRLFEQANSEKLLMPAENEISRLKVRGTTYMVKECTGDRLIAFNGSKYLIVTRSSKQMYICAICMSRSRFEEATRWLEKLTEQLSQNDF